VGGDLKYKGSLNLIVIIICSLLLNILTMNINVTAESIKHSKVINVVYDDSGSMIENNGFFYEKWSQAKYSMEVFAAMLDKDDILNVFPMSQMGKKSVSISGNETPMDRVAKIHLMNYDAGETPYEPVASAINDLKNYGEDFQKWVVVLTDGDFNKTLTTEVESRFASYVANGKIRIVFLGIGEDVKPIQNKPQKGIYFYNAPDGKAILDRVTQIANQIFERQALNGNNYIKKVSNGFKLNFDVPMEQVIVFAQGEGIQIGELEGFGKNGVANKISNTGVAYSDLIPQNYYAKYGDKIRIDRSLKGEVAVFNSSTDPIPMADGTYTIDISNTSNVNFYYKPSVKLQTNIIQDGKVVEGNENLFTGKYNIQLDLINPLTGVKVNSGLLDGTKYKVTIKNNENTFTITDFTKLIEAEKGTLSITGEAELPGYIYLTDTKELNVIPAPQVLNVKLDMPSNGFSLKNFEKNGEYIKITVFDENCSILSREKFDITELFISETKNNDWQLVKGDDVGTWKLYPKYFQGDILKTATGDINVTIVARYQVGELIARGKSDSIVYITDMSAVERFMEWLKRNWSSLLLWILSLLLILGYIPPFKKYFSRKIKPKVSTLKRGAVPVSRHLQKDFVSTIIPYKAQTGTINPNYPGTSFSKMKLKADNGCFYLTNSKNYVGNKNIKFNGDFIDKDNLKPIRMPNGTDVVMTVGANKYRCNLI
jgi:hypothetical protein